jgi:catechol 2,3-dioxygenase-like lactoylglutathione lyase family enzyme
MEADMIDHVSIGVRDLAASARFYDRVLEPLGYSKLVQRPTTVGYGKKYPDFWLNERRAMVPPQGDSGMHICLRASTTAAVEAFYSEALKAGATSEGAPGLRAEYTDKYFAAFIRDPDGNKIEAVTFVETA